MGVTNWLGQELNVGDLVYKARRAGNGTDQMVGRIMSIGETKYFGQPPRATVEWYATPSGRTYFDKDKRVHVEKPPQAFYAKILDPDAERKWDRPIRGSNDTDSLVKIEKCPLTDTLDIPF